MNQLQKRAEQFLSESQTDALTGLANRRTMDRWIQAWLKEGKPFSIISLDIDYFKQVNDTYGHQVGDQVLKYLAEVLLSNTRNGDFPCRYGGEEFCILLPNTSHQEAFIIAERIRTELQSKNSPSGKPITVSIGIAVYPNDAETAQQLLQRADQALYTAKHQGRNRTIVYDHIQKSGGNKE